MTGSRWFAAVLLFQSQVGPGWDDEPSIDHQVRLVHAASADEAYRRALLFGEEGEHAYSNAAGEQVRWQFLGVAELDELLDGAPADGSEVFSWRTAERGEGLVPEKHQLAVFRAIANRNRRAGDLLAE